MPGGMFLIKVDFIKSELPRQIALQPWMLADAEIITEDVSIQTRILRSLRGSF
jgi:hypothetical protein